MAAPQINTPFPVNLPVIDPKTGLMTTAGQQFFFALFNRSGQSPGVNSQTVQQIAEGAAVESTAAQVTANTATSSAAAAQTTANTGVANAATAQGTANTALANAATAQSGANASLKKASNLSDLASAGTARGNLGLGPVAVAATRTGWTAPTGTPTRTTFNANASTTASGGYVQAEAQAVNDQVVVVARRLAALIDDLTTSNVIGP